MFLLDRMLQIVFPLKMKKKTKNNREDCMLEDLIYSPHHVLYVKKGARQLRSAM